MILELAVRGRSCQALPLARRVGGGDVGRGVALISRRLRWPCNQG